MTTGVDLMPRQRGTSSSRAHALITIGAALVLVLAFGGTAFANGNGASDSAPHGGTGQGASQNAPHGNGPDGNGPPGHQQETEDSFSAQSIDSDADSSRGSGGGNKAGDTGGGKSQGPPTHASQQGTPDHASGGGTPPGQQAPASEPGPAGGSAGAPAPATPEGSSSPPASEPGQPSGAPTGPAAPAGTAPSGAQSLVAREQDSPGASTPSGATEPRHVDVAELLAPQAAGEQAAPEARLFDRAADRTARTVDTVLSPGRDFGVPLLLVAILGMYLTFQRRLDRGILPMSGLSSTPDGDDSHVRYEL